MTWEIFLQLLQSVLVWPTTALILGLVLLVQHKKAIGKKITDLLGIKAGPAELTFGEASREQEKAVERAAEDKTALLTAATPEEVAEQHVRLNPKDTVFEFKRILTQLHFANVLNSIFGSQLRLLFRLQGKENGIPIAEVRAIHDAEMAGLGVTNSDFQKWLDFLRSVNVIEYAPDGSSIRLSATGVVFLEYLRRTYPTGYPFRAF